jgi:hypothetical protein
MATWPWTRGYKGLGIDPAEYPNFYRWFKQVGAREAVAKGSAVNNDGALKVGYTAPGVEGQAGHLCALLAHVGRHLVARLLPAKAQLPNHAAAASIRPALQLHPPDC